jgi:thiol-disulfide isomerase/thioredoxin
VRRLLGVMVLVWVAGCASAPDGGERLPPEARLRLPDTAGREHDVDAALGRGETVALVAWQTWCPSCRGEAPEVVEAARRHGDAIRFFGLVPGKPGTVDDREVEATAAAWGYAFPQLRDRDLAACRALGIEGTPTIVVLGPDRAVRYRGHRSPADWGALRGAPLGSTAPVGSDCPGGVCPLPGGQR